MKFKNIKVCLTDNLYLNNRLKHLIGDNVKNVCYINSENRYFLYNIGDRCLAKSEGVILMNVFDSYGILNIGDIYKDLCSLKDVSDKNIFIVTNKKNIYKILISMFVEMFEVENVEVKAFTTNDLSDMIINKEESLWKD